MFNPAIASENIKDEFIDYILSAFFIADDEYNKLFREQLNNNGVVSKGPFIDIKDIFKAGNSLDSLIDKGVLSPLYRKLEADKPKMSGYKVNLPLSRPLYTHQEKAIDVITSKKMNAVVTTGTGSGKTECFLIPVINELLREKEAGTLGPGVRAILIYPMNALANDQMKRLRNILMYYPDITFGVYNGDTEWNEKRAEAKYNDLHFNESLEELRTHLPNELISRDEMNENPPHILCTNYAMLEHMLLRPENDKIFKNSNFKFVVLDESHIYSGATGMETALLLRRLKARIHSESKTQFILTSATLGIEGKSEADIIKFAENLCGEPFASEGIVYGVRDDVDYSKSNNIIPIEIYNELAYASPEEYKNIFNKYNINYNDAADAKENLYDLCFYSELYKHLRFIINGPIDIHILSKELNISVEELVSFIHVCAIAEKNRKSLIDAKYHFFIRALEGVYTPLVGSKQLFLNRKDKAIVNNHEVAVFERIVCNNCGDLGIVGKIEKRPKLDYLVLSSQYEKKDVIKHFHIVKDDEEEFVVMDDEVNEDVDEDEEKKLKSKKKQEVKLIKYKMCPTCGAINEYDDGNPKCGCGTKTLVLTEFQNKEKRCTKCQSGSYRRFYIGNEAATGVLATTLFEELPSKTIKEKDLEGITREYEGGKQFLAFSDSRSDAAFFASYLDKMYKEFIRRRGIYQVVHKLKDDFEEEPIPVDDFVSELAKFFRKNESFKDDLSEVLSAKEAKNVANRNAWIAVLNELISARRRSSLASLGLIKFGYRGNGPKIVQAMAKAYDIDTKPCKDLLDFLALSIAYFGALEIDDYIITPNDRKYIFFTEQQKSIILEKESTTSRYFMGWKARNREGKADSYYMNNRLKIVSRVLKSDEATANQFLDDYFSNYLIKPENEYKMTRGKGDFYFMPIQNYEISSNATPDAEWFKCDKCGKVSTIDIDGCCLENGCSGHFEKVRFLDKEIENNHYLNLYQKKDMMNLIVREHTAQLSREEALEYQIAFEKNKIHALSCSTTFEMGVDVGDLETVFLRDVPPTAANYAQRAGRAGRSDNAAAYSLTYAKLSSHDFTYFKEPKKIIVGNIKPPMFKIDNEKIVLRHINSVVLSYFFSITNYFNENHAQLFLEEGGYEELIKMIDEYPQELNDLLTKSIPNLEKFDWKAKLIGKNGTLSTAVKEYKEDVDEMNKIIEENAKVILDKKATDAEKTKASRTTERYQRSLNKYRAVDMIDFLVRNNILPKYGFPIDSVDLDVNNNKEKKDELQLSRDLKMAISEYAPGEKVIANNKMFTSRYIKKSFFNNKMDYHISYVCECGECSTWNYAKEFKDKVNTKCVACGTNLPSTKWDEAIEPRAGFIAENESQDVPMSRPERIYRSNDSYIGDGKKIVEHEYDINGNTVIFRSSENDSIMTVSNTDFYVCPYCGYTYGIHDRILNKNGKEDKKATNDRLAGFETIEIKRVHQNPRGKDCKNTSFKRKKINHIFRTDVVVIDFGSLSRDYDTMLSVMYALLNGMSEALDIDFNDISGCLKISTWDHVHPNYSIVLYDSVPGGAGHVTRLLTDDNLLKNVISTAYSRVSTCNCDTSCYSCLRSYNNQRFHDNLDRNKAADFLQYLVGNATKVKETVPVQDSIEEEVKDVPLCEFNLKITNECTRLSKDDLDEYIDYLKAHGATDDIANTIRNKVISKEITMPDYKDSEFDAKDQHKYCSYMWKNKKVMLFDDEDSELVSGYECSKNSDFMCFFLDDNFNFNRLIKYFMK